MDEISRLLNAQVSLELLRRFLTGEQVIAGYTLREEIKVICTVDYDNTNMVDVRLFFDGPDGAIIGLSNYNWAPIVGDEYREGRLVALFKELKKNSNWNIEFETYGGPNKSLDYLLKLID